MARENMSRPRGREGGGAPASHATTSSSSEPALAHHVSEHAVSPAPAPAQTSAPPSEAVGPLAYVDPADGTVFCVPRYAPGREARVAWRGVLRGMPACAATGHDGGHGAHGGRHAGPLAAVRAALGGGWASLTLGRARALEGRVAVPLVLASAWQPGAGGTHTHTHTHMHLRAGGASATKADRAAACVRVCTVHHLRELPGSGEWRLLLTELGARRTFVATLPRDGAGDAVFREGGTPLFVACDQRRVACDRRAGGQKI